MIYIHGIPKTVMIKNADLMNTWALACYAVNKYGVIVPSGPNYTSNPDYIPPRIKEIRAVIEHDEKSITQMLNKKIPGLYPQHKGLEQYINQLTPGNADYEHGRTFHYSYGLRLREMDCLCDYYCGPCDGFVGYYRCEYYDKGIYTEGECYLDQLNFIAEHLEPFNKRMQAITWIPEIDLPNTIVDENIKSVPCLQRTHLENYYDKYYSLLLDWRSRDLFKAYMWNIDGLICAIDTLIQEKREQLGQPKLKLVQVVEFIDSLHAYEPEWEKAAKVPIEAKTIIECLHI